MQVGVPVWQTLMLAPSTNCHKTGIVCIFKSNVHLVLSLSTVTWRDAVFAFGILGPATLCSELYRANLLIVSAVLRGLLHRPLRCILLLLDFPS